jgi:hypothetical protein
MLSVIMLNVVMLSVVAPVKCLDYKTSLTHIFKQMDRFCSKLVSFILLAQTHFLGQTL